MNKNPTLNINLSRFTPLVHRGMYLTVKPRVIDATERFIAKPLIEFNQGDVSEAELERNYIGTVEVQQERLCKIYAGSDAVITQIYQTYINDPKTTDIIFR